MKRACFLILFALAACGYQFSCEDCEGSRRTLSIATIDGDWDGNLTTNLAEYISRSGCYAFQSCGGDLSLEVNLIDFRDENIGFRYDRKRNGELRNSVIPTETRVSVDAEVILREACSGNIVLGPVRLTANFDYDHEFYSGLKATNIFSLGQLTPYDAADDIVYRPLNKVLAQKIIDFITDSW
jgi:hypothetical protein